MKVGPRSDWRDAAAAQWCLTLVVAAVADCRQTDDQPAAKIPNTCADHNSVFPPSYTHLDKRSRGIEQDTKKGKNVSLIEKNILFQG